MRSALLFMLLVFSAAFTRQEPPACGAAALDVAPDSWDAATAMTGDLTLDGNEDVVFWKKDGDAVMLYIAACEGEQAVQTWRYRIELPDCPQAEPAVQVASLLIDASLMERVCSSGDSEECQHMRMENKRRQAIADAGGRELRVGGQACPGARFRWSSEKRGFMRFDG